MIISSLPDSNHYAARPPTFTSNVVVFARTNERYFYPEHFTPYLFLTNFVSRGTYAFNGKKIELSDRSFWLSNPNDTLEVRFENAMPLETLLILFDETFFINAYSFYQKSERELLESPVINLDSPPSFPNVPFESNSQLRMMLMNLLDQTAGQDILDERLIDLVGKLAQQTETTAARISNLNAVKKSTRQELYRRLYIAKVFMEDHSPADLNIDRIAQEACLNKFHFITTFKSLFNVTPNQYLMSLRLEKAYHLLKNEQMTVTEACHTVGYESLGSFSNAFMKRFKISPSLLKQ